MTGFLLFSLLIATAAVMIWRGVASWRRLKRVGIGGPDEDLDAARTTIKGLILTGAVLAASLAGAFVVEWQTGDLWKHTIHGRIILTSLVVLAAGWLVVMQGYTVRQQWSRNGSLGGMLKGMALTAVAMLATVLAAFWLLG